MKKDIKQINLQAFITPEIKKAGEKLKKVLNKMIKKQLNIKTAL